MCCKTCSYSWNWGEFRIIYAKINCVKIKYASLHFFDINKLSIFFQLTGKMIFWTFVSLLPRKDFDPWFFRPFESFWLSKGFDAGLGPLSDIQREPDFNLTTPRFNHRNFQTTFEMRSHDSPAVTFADNFFSDLLKNIEESIELINEGIM